MGPISMPVIIKTGLKKKKKKGKKKKKEKSINKPLILGLFVFARCCVVRLKNYDKRGRS